MEDVEQKILDKSIEILEKKYEIVRGDSKKSHRTWNRIRNIYANLKTTSPLTG